MNKLFGIIGAVFFIAAVVIGKFCNFAGDVVVQVALEAFGFASLIISVVKTQKEKGDLNWKTILALVCASIGGTLCAVGGFEANVFELLSGAVLAILAIIFGILTAKK